MVGIDDPGALNEFLHRFLDDRERGAVQQVDAYQALFPGSAAAIAAEYATLTGRAQAVAEMAGGEVQQIGPYRLLGKLGQGSFGLVYRAEDTRLQRTVALKVLARAGLESEREREQFEREAAIASRLDHPGICTMYEIARHGLWTCIAMRCVPGETLATKLAGVGIGAARMPPADAVLLVEKVARALHAAHSAGVVHRDVKPGNIMVTPAGEPVVVDFGLARDTRNGTGSLSALADRIGSPSYMAPEQVEADLGPVDARTDVWALGVTLYECLAGVRPFAAPTQAGLFEAILRREPVALRRRAPHVSRDLEVVVATALAKQPAARYQSAQHFADDLQRVRRGEPVLARPIGRLGRAWRWARRNPAIASLLATVLLVLSSGLAVAGALWMQAEHNLRDWERLADGRKFVQLQQQAEAELLPPGPDQVAAITTWLAAAKALLSRQGEHERALLELRARARPWSASTAALEQQKDAGLQRVVVALDARVAYVRERLLDLAANPEPADRVRPMRRAYELRIENSLLSRQRVVAAIDERRCYEFDDVRDQLQHDEITELVLGLRQLTNNTVQGITSLATMEARLEWSRTVRQRTIDDHAAAWRAASARILDNPAYQGYALAPQVGLVPLGPDPQSRLEEFAELATGEIPERGADGRLVVTATMAVVFVLLPPGRFVMGAQAADAQAAGFDPMARVDEQPVRELDVDVAFLAKFELTQGQWHRLANDNPSTFNPGQRDGDCMVDDSHPVETVSYEDCIGALRRAGLWLPNEAHWEYACRAGTTTPWPCPESDLTRYANVADRGFKAGDAFSRPSVDGDDGHVLHAPVGSFRPNAFGMHDMIGNVSEWCFDQFMPYDAKLTTAQPVPHQLYAKDFIARGGNFGSAAPAVRAAARERWEGTLRSCYTGVRPMRAVARE